MKKLLLLFALFLSAGQFAFAQDVNISGTVLCPDGTQFNSSGINYIFMTLDSAACCVDSIGIPLDSNGNFDYTFPGEIDGTGWISLWYGTADGNFVDVDAFYSPGNTQLTFILDACALKEEPCSIDIIFGTANQEADQTFVYIETTTNIIDPMYVWEFGDGGTSTDPNPTHVYTEIGTYTICATVTGLECSATDCIEITVDAEGNGQEGGGMMIQGFTLVVNGQVTSTSEQNLEEISVYPNPIVPGKPLLINAPFTLTGDISLYSISGSLIENYTSTLGAGTNTLSINTANLLPGVYVLQIIDNTYKMQRFKLIY